MAKVSSEVRVVRYELVCLLVNSGCEDVQLKYGFDDFIITHFTTNTSSTMQPRRMPATFSPCLLLHGYHGFCFGFRHAEIDAEIHQFVSNEYSRLCWPNFYLGPRDCDGEREREGERHTEKEKEKEKERERKRERERERERER